MYEAIREIRIRTKAERTKVTKMGSNLGEKLKLLECLAFQAQLVGVKQSSWPYYCSLRIEIGCRGQRSPHGINYLVLPGKFNFMLCHRSCFLLWYEWQLSPIDNKNNSFSWSDQTLGAPPFRNASADCWLRQKICNTNVLSGWNQSYVFAVCLTF